MEKTTIRTEPRGREPIPPNRENGDLVLFLTRLGEKDPQDWRKADMYRYRIELD